MTMVLRVLAESLHYVGPTNAVQVGKAVFVKKTTLPWVSSPGPSLIQEDIHTIKIVASVGE